MAIMLVLLPPQRRLFWDVGDIGWGKVYMDAHYPGRMWSVEPRQYVYYDRLCIVEGDVWHIFHAMLNLKYRTYKMNFLSFDHLISEVMPFM